MKKISRLKLLFVALPIIIIALLLFIRWIDYGKSYKSLISWGKGNMMYSEQAYYSSRIRSIITEWQKAGKRIDDNENNTYLIVDLERNAIWLEKDGQPVTEYYLELPKNNLWKLLYSSPQKSVELSGKTILYIKDKTIFLSGQFYFYCNTNNQTHYYNFNTESIDIGYPPPVSTKSIGPGLPNEQDYTSLIVSEEGYNKYKDSLVQKNIAQSSEKETQEQVTLTENKAKWFDIEKYLYMEIDGQLQNTGYKFNHIQVQTGHDYTNASAVIQGFGNSAIHKLLRLSGGIKTIRAHLNIYYLGDDIWYAKTTLRPNLKLESDRKLNLEFLIFEDEQIPRSKYWKYIKLGRKALQTESFLSSKWKVSLPNGTTVQIIGIKNDKETDIWWGPDGSPLKFPDYFKIKSIHPDREKNVTFIAWQRKLPKRKDGTNISFKLESAKYTRAIDIQNEYGITEIVMISVFDNHQEKTDFNIIINVNDKVTQFTAFKNISLIKGKDQGFVIEH